MGLVLIQSHPARLLTTRLRITVALIWTTLIFTLRILYWGRTKSGWLLTPGFLLHGWLLLAVNIFFYAYLCWLGFWFIRGTTGRERFFMMGWFADLLLWPLQMLRPEWAVVIKHIGAFGIAVALLAALSLLLEMPDASDPSTSTNAT
jgi:hypothetical protein